MATKGTIIFSSPVFTGNTKRKLFTRRNKANLNVILPAIPTGRDVAKTKMDTLQTLFDDGYWDMFGDGSRYSQKRGDLYNGRGRDWRYTPLINLNFSDAVNSDNSFWDLRSGICINRHTQTMIPTRNYSLETVFKNTKFNLSFDLSRLSKTDMYKALAVLNEWEEGRFFFGEGKTRGLGVGKVIIDWDKLNKSDYKSEKANSKFNGKANWIELNIRLPLDEPLLINWNYEIFNKGGEFYVTDEDPNTGSEIRPILEDEKRHKKAARDAERNGGSIEYKGRQVNKYNLEKAHTNDRNIVEFFKHYGDKIRAYLDEDTHKDYREKTKLQNPQGYDDAKIYDKLPVKLLSKDGFDEIYIPGSTLKGAFRARAQQIVKTIFDSNELHCHVGTGTTVDKCPRGCIVCELFGKMGDKSKILFYDAYPVGEIKLYPADSVPICRVSGKGLNKSNLLFAYNPEAYMETKVLIKNIRETDKWMLALIGHVLKDLTLGDIPIGTGKWCGLGRLKGQITSVRAGCHKGHWLADMIEAMGVELDSGFFWDGAEFTFNDISNYDKVLTEWQSEFLKKGGKI